jgi:hypothetical protein
MAIPMPRGRCQLVAGGRRRSPGLERQESRYLQIASLHSNASFLFNDPPNGQTAVSRDGAPSYPLVSKGCRRTFGRVLDREWGVPEIS